MSDRGDVQGELTRHFCERAGVRAHRMRVRGSVESLVEGLRATIAQTVPDPRSSVSTETTVLFMPSAAKDGRGVMAPYGPAGGRPAVRILAEVRSIRARDRGEPQRVSRELPTRTTANQLVDETPTSLELLGCTVTHT